MTPAEYREIAKALRAARDELNAHDKHEQSSAITLNQLSNVADHMAKWAEDRERQQNDFQLRVMRGVGQDLKTEDMLPPIDTE